MIQIENPSLEWEIRKNDLMSWVYSLSLKNKTF